eukprot:TRINITY_DN1755_c0_g1_i13.p1 TRINITY_DN1755_c0_g1~~TRINITY_DN1755_c0_g1_i13.p1  ORF type:complete len:3322 (-),score=584.61 TRINITY_DN1755_c0_g1_i13:304-9891(-)
MARGLWAFQANIGFDFAIGGSLGMFVEPGHSNQPDVHSCWATHNCTVATAEIYNHLTIQRVLYPGKHTLWLYDAVGEKTYTGCIPFTLDLKFEQVEEAESFLNCNGERLPETFDTPGFIDITGRMHYREKVFFDVAVMKQVVSFSGTADSVFRLYIADSEVDIDIALYKGDNANLVASSFSHEPQEGLVYHIPPDGDDTYYLHLIRILNDGSSTLFCPTFTLEVSLAPAEDFAYECPFVGEKVPNLGKMQELITKAPHWYDFYDSKLGYNASTHQEQFTLFEKEFSTAKDLRLFVETTFDFVVGSVEVSLHSSAGKVLSRSVHSGNRNVLDTALPSGSYKLVFSSSHVQALVQDSIYPFLGCVTYALRIIASTPGSFPQCSTNMKLPSDINIPGYMSPSGRGHIIGNYEVPEDETHTMSVKVTKASTFRVRVDNSLVNVNLALKRGSEIVTTNPSSNAESSLLAFLESGHEYLFVMTFIRGDDIERGQCLDIRMEMTVFPNEDYEYTQKRCTDKLPPGDYFSLKPGNDENLYKTFRFAQTGSNLKHRLPLVVTEHAGFRFIMKTDFGFSGLSARLLVPGGPDKGQSVMNGRSIPTVILTPGSYALEIYEPNVMDSKMRHCIEFSISFGIVKASSEDEFDPEDYFTCKNARLPYSLNSPAFLAPSSGYALHFVDRFVAESSTETMAFHLSKKSLVRLYTPAHPGMNVDIALYKGTVESPGSILQSQLTDKPETIFVELDSGDYHFRTFNRPTSAASVPSREHCVTIPYEVALAPLDMYAEDPIFTQCVEAAPPATLKVPSTLDQAFTFRRTAGTPYKHTISFQMKNEGTIDVSLLSQFLVGHVTFTLEGEARQGLPNPVEVFETGLISYHQTFLRLGLSPGDYKIVIQEPESAQELPASRIVCTHFQLAIKIVDGTNPEACAKEQKIPLNLFATDGGSVSYGGPQREDGMIRFYGESFVMKKSETAHLMRDMIQFKVPQDSVLRIFAQPHQPESDIDFVIYRGDIQNISNVVGFFFGDDQIESKTITLSQSQEIFTLVISYFSVPDIACPYYHLELAIKPKTAVDDSISCAENPYGSGYIPPSFDVLPNQTLSFMADDLRLNVYHSIPGAEYDYERDFSINIHAAAQTRIEVGFDFLVSDFSLELKKKSGEVVAVSRYEGSINRNSYVNFYSVISSKLEQGEYKLSLHSSVYRSDNNQPHCYRYSFSIQSEAEDGPVIYAVNPPGARELNPQEDLILRISFSEAVHKPDSSALISQNIVTLSEFQTPPIFPSEAYYGSDKMSLRVIFKSSNFRPGQVLSLKLNNTAFLNKDQKPFSIESRDYYYFMSYCNCHGNGQCRNTTEGLLQCQCQEPYTGSGCLDCMSGYHHVGMACYADLKCSASSCNGHGTCDDSRGYPVCSCETGYATVGDDFCSGCAAGYSGFPDCKPLDSSDNRQTTCYAPLLPTTLDDVSYRGDLHLQDWYFLDLQHLSHQTTFTLNETSVFRAYAGVHTVDVDIRLYRIEKDGAAVLIEKSIAYGGEEVIYVVLPGTKSGIQYRIDFAYYIWQKPTAKMECEVFDFELAISTYHTVFSTAPHEDKCPSTDNLRPLIAEPFIVGNEGYKFVSNAPASRVAVKDVEKWEKYFYSVNFTVPSAPENHRARLQATIDYRFLHGQLGLLLQEGDTFHHCGDNKVHPSPCVTGLNSYNQNFLDVTLTPGAYRLWIYEPAPQNASVAKCSQFTLEVSIRFEEMRENSFSCTASRLPLSFNSQPYLSVDGFLHLQDDFFLDLSKKTHTTSFSLARESLLRIFVPEMQIDIDLFIYKAGQHDEPVVRADNYLKDEVVFVSLQSGDYELVFEFYVPMWVNPTSLSFCSTFPMEIAIAPVRMEYPADLCQGGQDIIPRLPLITAPFSFGTDDKTNHSALFYTYEFGAQIPRREVATYDMLVTENSYLMAGVSTDFLRSDMILSLTSNSTTTVIYGKHRKNHNHLEIMLQPGSYKLSIIQVLPSHSSTPPCNVFNFRVSLEATQTRALTCSTNGAEIPQTINNMRYLGLDSRFHIQSDDFLIPPMTYYTTKTVKLNVKKASMFRVYSEPHEIDIDLKLYKNGASRRYSDLVASGISFNGEETVVAVLSPDLEYELDIIFYKWSVKVDDCATFNMEMALAPLSSSPLPPMCPNNGADHWPPSDIFAAITRSGTVRYNNEEANEYLYVQQTRLGKSRSYHFEVLDEVSIFAEVGYNFLFGDMVLKLNGSSLGEDIVGDNYQDRNRLVARELPVGNYTFTIYEPAITAQSEFGCSFFTFHFVAIQEELDEGIGDPSIHPPIPQTMDTIGFLHYDSSVHLQGEYLIPYGKRSLLIPFTLQEESLVRIYTEPHRYDIDLYIMNIGVQPPTVVANSISLYDEESILQALSGGKYAFKIAFLPTSDGFVPLKGDANTFNMEIAIFPTKAIHLPPSTTCHETGIPEVILSPQGYYAQRRITQYISPDKLASEDTIHNIPFEIKTRSRIYARVGYDFLLNDLAFELIGDKMRFMGDNGRNFNEVDEIIEPGSYKLVLYQPSVMIENFKHCAEFSYELKIQSATALPNVCQVFDLLPWDLNSDRGGSLPHGGPIDVDGELRMYGAEFVMYENSVEKISMKVQHNSFLRIYARPQSRYSTMRVSVQRDNSTILPTNKDQFANEISLLYHLKPGTSSEPYMLSYFYEKISSTREACPYFGSQIILRKESTVTQQLTCPNPLPSVTLPAAAVKLDRLGMASESFATVIPSHIINNQRIDGVFTHSINITVTERSYLDAVAGFDYLANDFRLRLKNKWGFIVNNGVDEPQAQKSGSTQFNSAVHHVLFPGSYVLELVELSKSEVLTFYPSACVPLVWSLQIIPITPAPYVREVLPPSGHELSPDSETTISISVSARLYDKDGNALSAGNNGILGAFYLEQQQTTTRIYPSSVDIVPEENKLILHFRSKSMQPANTYALKLSPATLFDPSNKEVVLASQHVYNFMDNRCGDHGHMSTSGFICICDDGWVGRHCEIDASRLCGDHGHMSSGMCLCQTGYSGESCEYCAHGYYKDPSSGKCLKGKTCPDCGENGQCNAATGHCICEPLFQGPTCSECIDGHTGDDCQSRIIDDDNTKTQSHFKVVTITLTIVLIISAMFLLFKKAPQLFWRKTIWKRKNMMPYQFLRNEPDHHRDVEMSQFQIDGDEEDDDDDDFEPSPATGFVRKTSFQSRR